MTKILPVKVIGAEATFTAIYDDGEIHHETYTNTPDGRTAEDIGSKEALMIFMNEFSLLVAERETSKSVPKEPSVVDARAEYFDPEADFKKMTAKQAGDKLKEAFPVEEATAIEGEIV